jgi:hypothetical protein
MVRLYARSTSTSCFAVCEAFLASTTAVQCATAVVLLPPQVLLDFDGHTTSGTKYNSMFFSGQSFDTPAYDIDGNTSAYLMALVQQQQHNVAS